MSHPRIEEVEDSDVDMSDPSEGDIDDFDDTDILRSRAADKKPSQQQQPQAPAGAKSHLLAPNSIPTVSAGPPTAGGGGDYSIPTTASAKAYAGFQCLYPVYFDATRTRAEGRRVPRALAVASPLAREIVNACRDLRLQTLFEPEKTHPKDWANPGRVKVQPLNEGAAASGGGGGGGGVAGIKNKHQLYVLVAQHLRNHPSGERSAALWEQIPGGPAPPDRSKPYPRPAVPRGWKVGEFLPYYSPAITGGGVSENLLQDMMKEMQGAGGGGGMPGLPGGMDMASLLGGMGGMGGMGGGGGSGAGSGNVSEDGAGKKKNKKGKGKA